MCRNLSGSLPIKLQPGNHIELAGTRHSILPWQVSLADEEYRNSKTMSRRAQSRDVRMARKNGPRSF